MTPFKCSSLCESFLYSVAELVLFFLWRFYYAQSREGLSSFWQLLSSWQPDACPHFSFDEFEDLFVFGVLEQLHGALRGEATHILEHVPSDEEPPAVAVRQLAHSLGHLETHIRGAVQSHGCCSLMADATEVTPSSFISFLIV